MTSSYAGIVVFDVLLLGAGLGALVGLGFVRSRRDALRHAGLALFLGWAAVGSVECVTLVLGAPIARWLVVVVCLAIGVGGLALSRVVPGRRLPAVGETGRASWIAVAGIAIVVVQFAALLRRSLAAGAPLQWDAWAFWLPKAKSIVDYGGLTTGLGGFTSFANPGYPPFVPAVEASTFAFMGNTHAAPLALQHWIVAAAFLGAVASLLATRVRPAILWPFLALLSLLPTFTKLIGSSLGDEPLMLLVGAGGVCAALWLLDGDARFAALAAVFLAASALAKVEGLPIALVIALTLLVSRPRRPLAPALMLLAPIVAIVPWKLWLHYEHVPVYPDYRLSELLHPSLLGDRIHRLTYALHALPTHLFDPGRWLIALPLLLVAAVVAARRRPSLTALALVPVVAIPLGLLVIYWIGYPPVQWYVLTTADRVVASAVVLAVVFLPLLVSEIAQGDAVD